MSTHDVSRPARDHRTLLRQIVELLAQTGPTQPTAVGIALPGGEVELAVKPLDRGDLVQALAGFRAPESWQAFAVVAPAIARPLAGGPPQSVVAGGLAARDGFTTSVLVGLDAAHGDAADDDGDGRVLDACRRVLDLPTAAPTLDPRAWAALHWVEGILRAALAADLDAAPSWPRIRRLDEGARYAARPWSAVRRACAAGRIRLPGIDRVAARWMDDGLFSREVIGGYPPLTEMVADLRELLPWSTYEQLLRALCDRLEAVAAPTAPTEAPPWRS